MHFEKLIVRQPLKKLISFCSSQKPGSQQHSLDSKMCLTQPAYSVTTLLFTPMLLSISYLLLSLPAALFISDFKNRVLYEFII